MHSVQKPCVAILERSRVLDERVAQAIESNLVEVFEDSILIRQLYFDELPEGSDLDADVILLPIMSLLPQISGKIRQGSEKLLLAGRIFPQQVMKRLESIPRQAHVLVVSTSAETARDSQRLLYQMGVNWLYLDAYDPDITDPGPFGVAITPGELKFVPHEIKQVIDIGYRKLDTQTFLSLLTRLNIDDERIVSNLLHYIRHLPPMDSDINERYTASFLINKALHAVIDQDKRGVIITDPHYRIIHCNKKTMDILDIAIKRGELLTQIWPKETKGDVSSPSFQQVLTEFGGEPVIVNKTVMSSGRETVGYYFNLETGRSIHAADVNLSKRMRESGLIARYSFTDILFCSGQMAQCIKTAKTVAVTDYTVLVTGETGTGKELIAQSIHNYSRRRQGPFVAINCAALPESLLESELFGYERGAFTGSLKEGKPGLFERANRGTIFLDEIGDMPLQLQLRLLRVLQERQIMRIGSNSIINIDVRVIAATNRNLVQEVAKKNFREDLFYRLNGFCITLPPLRERKEDILYIFEKWLEGSQTVLSERDRQNLIRHKWLGNIRELRNAVNYYRMMGYLPDLSYGYGKDRHAVAPVELTSLLLERIALAGAEGVGRTRLYRCIKDAGVSISEQRLEQQLTSLQQMGLIDRRKGRQGCLLTEKGYEELKMV